MAVVIHKELWYTLDCFQGKSLFTGVFTQCGRMFRVRVSVKIRVRFRFIYDGDPTCSHSLAVYKEYQNN